MATRLIDPDKVFKNMCVWCVLYTNQYPFKCEVAGDIVKGIVDGYPRAVLVRNEGFTDPWATFYVPIINVYARNPNDLDETDRPSVSIP